MNGGLTPLLWAPDGAEGCGRGSYWAHDSQKAESERARERVGPETRSNAQGHPTNDLLPSANAPPSYSYPVVHSNY